VSEPPVSSDGHVQIAAVAEPASAGAIERVFRVDGRDDRRIIYRDNEREDAPLTLLLLHGIGSSKVAWKYLAPAFDDRYRVVTLDLLGHGDSDKPVEFGYSMGEQADIIRKIIAERELSNLVLIGHSYGAGVALEIALSLMESGNPWMNTAADGRTPIIRGIVALDPCALQFPKPHLLTLMQGTSVSLLDLLFSTQKRARLVLEVVFWDRSRILPDLEAEYVRVFQDPRTSDVYSWIADKELFKELAARKGREGRYRAIVCPVLVLRGEHDRVGHRSVPRRAHPDVAHARRGRSVSFDFGWRRRGGPTLTTLSGRRLLAA
jgi:pimeloyl-ACP methyl ester carboxylesterase